MASVGKVNKKNRKKSSSEIWDEELAALLKEQIKEQFALWKLWFSEPMRMQSESLKGMDEIIPIVTRHWGHVSKLITEATPQMLESKEGFVEKLRKLYEDCALSYSNMLKEIMATDAFGTYIGAVLNRFFDTKIGINRSMEESLKAMRIPTKSDIDGINKSIYHLSKKLDMVLDRVKSLGQQQEQKQERKRKARKR